MKSQGAVVIAVLVTVLAFAGFYPTYFSKFPEFAGLAGSHHFHGFMMTTWFAMLIAQPLLITNNKLSVHRLLGKLSYVVAPFVVISIFLVCRLEYYDDMSKYTRERSLAGLDVDLMSMFSFVILYSLAILYRKRMDYHMRFMICTGLLVFIPGLARLFVFVFRFSGPVTGMSILAITYGVYIGLIFYDKSKKKTVMPYVVGVVLVTLTNLAVAMNKSAGWQWIAGNFADLAF